MRASSGRSDKKGHHGLPVRSAVRFAHVAENILFSLELRETTIALKTRKMSSTDWLDMVGLYAYADPTRRPFHRLSPAVAISRALAAQTDCILYENPPRWSTPLCRTT